MFNVLLLRRLNPPIPVKEQLLQCSWQYFKLACIYGSRWSETKPAKILRYSLFFVQALYLVVIMLLWSVAAYMESDSLSSLIGNAINCLIIQLAFVMFVHFFLNSDAYYRLNDMLTNDLNFQFEHRTTTIGGGGNIFDDRSDRIRFVASVFNTVMLISAILMFFIAALVTLVSGHFHDYPQAFILRLDVLFGGAAAANTHVQIMCALGNILFIYTVFTFRNGMFISMYCTYLCIIGSYKELHYKLTNLNISDKTKAKSDFIECVRHHKTLIRIYSAAVQFYGICNFIIIFVGGAIITLSEFSAVQDNITGAQLVPYVASVVSIIPVSFLICYVGTIIHDLNDQVRDAIYNSDWLAAEVELRKMMIMVMCYTHRPLTLKTGIYKEASLVVFTTVIKMSFSYFNVLRAVNTT